MNEYRLTKTGQVLYEDALRSLFPQVSFPNTLDAISLATMGAEPVIPSPAPTTSPTEVAVRNGIVSDAHGNWIYSWAISNLSTEEIAAMHKAARDDKIALLPDKQDAIQAIGLRYVFPDGITGHAQTRSERDLVNINGLVTSASLLAASGVSAPVLEFRDAENINHKMTPAQMIALGMAASARVSAVYAAKWAHEAAIGNLPADKVAAYDINVGWPT